MQATDATDKACFTPRVTRAMPVSNHCADARPYAAFGKQVNVEYELHL